MPKPLENELTVTLAQIMRATEKPESQNSCSLDAQEALVQFTPEGVGIENAARILDRFLVENRFQQASGKSFGYYAALDYEPAAAFRAWVTTRYGHDMISRFCYEGTARFVDRAIREMGKEFFGCEDEYRGGLVLPSGTLAIQHTLQLSLAEFYCSLGHDYLIKGHNRNHQPVVLAPVHASFLIERVTQACGLGANACRFYSLTPSYDTDYRSLVDTVHEVYKKGGEIVLNFILGGDTQRGLVQDIRSIINAVEKNRPGGTYRPFVLVDSAPHAFNLWAQERAGEIGFSNPIDALLMNPQKNNFPLGGTLLFVRDVRRLASINGLNLSGLSADQFTEERLNLQAYASWLSARDASPTIAFFTTLLAKGISWFRDERVRVLENADYLRTLISSRKDLFSLLPSDNNVVPFMVRGHRSATRRVAEIINDSGQRMPGMFIIYSQYMRVRNSKQVKEAERQFTEQGYSDFDGLWATMFPVHTRRHIDEFFGFLCTAAEQLNRNLERK